MSLDKRIHRVNSSHIVATLCNPRLQDICKLITGISIWMTIWNQTQGFSLGPNPSSLHARNRQYLYVCLVFDQLSYPFVYIEGDKSIKQQYGWMPIGLLKTASSSMLPSFHVLAQAFMQQTAFSSQKPLYLCLSCEYPHFFLKAALWRVMLFFSHVFVAKISGWESTDDT